MAQITLEFYGIHGQLFFMHIERISTSFDLVIRTNGEVISEVFEFFYLRHKILIIGGNNMQKNKKKIPQPNKKKLYRGAHFS